MAEKNIPLRPKNKRFHLEEREMNCLAWYVLSKCKKDEAYLIFVRPDLVVSKKNLSIEASQFFSSAEARNFIAAYRNTLEGISVDSAEQEEKLDRDKKVQAAKDNFTDTVVEMMGGDISSIEQLDALSKVADRVGLLGEENKAEEKPRRYLVARCYSECAYRLFVETGVKNGDIIMDCDYCRTRKFAEEHGWKFDPTKNLDLPVGNDIEES